MASRYYSEVRKVSNPPKKAVGGVGASAPKKKSGASGFPSCKGSGGTFGAFQKYVGEAGLK